MIAKKTDKAVTIRFPPGVIDKVTDVAKANGRSRNTEIVVMLVESLKKRESASIRGEANL